MKTIVIILMVLLILGEVVGFYYLNKEVEMEQESKKERLYQGPVRPTDDEEHFRKTGETIPLKEKK